MTRREDEYPRGRDGEDVMGTRCEIGRPGGLDARTMGAPVRRRPLWRAAVLAALLLPWVAPSPAFAAGRVALVVGNGAYTQTSPLANPVNDARAVGAALVRIGFDVKVLENLDEDAMDDALGEFEEDSVAADVALLFYAGHGMEMNGANYLIPVDARLASASAVSRETVALDSVLAAMAGAGTRIVILDACRNNPFVRSMRGAARANVRSGGLAAVASGEGLLVAYAAAAGDVAADGDRSENSPYTTALLEHLERPGVDVRVMLGDVGAEVRGRTGDQQPFVYSSLSGELHLVGDDSDVTVADDAVIAARLQQETTFWDSVRNSTNPAAFDSYLRAYPNGRFADLARNRLVRLRGAVGDPPPTAAADHGDIEQIDIARLRLMAGQGDARAQTELGERYEEGRGMGRDYGMAVSWFRRAAEQGHAPGQAALGFMYDNGRGLPHDDGEAVRWYRSAAEQGDARGQNNLGVMYDHGRGVPRDVGEAVRLYRLAAEQGRVFGQSNLGVMYEHGRGVPRDVGEAVRLYRLAAEQGDVRGQYNLGLIYEHGRGVPRDDGEAMRLYRLAAGQGHATAQLNLDRMSILRSRQPGGVFRDCPSCPEMVVIPAGTFQMGSPASESFRDDDEGPQHLVTVSSFALGVTEVTWDEWEACERSGECGEPSGWWDRSRGKHPVTDVNWEDAQAYVAWLSAETGAAYRLPSESEWEYAARAGTTTPFHTGATISTDQANYNGDFVYGSGRRGVNRDGTTPVKTFAPNAFGLHDMHGNAWEWVDDCWHDNYRGAPIDGTAWTVGGDCVRRVLRSGGTGAPWSLRSAARDWINSVPQLDVGFRVARTLD